MDTLNNIKRSRSSNWSESEKALLTRLIKEKIVIIENKDVSKNNNQLKKAAWQDILQSFNQINETKRDLSQLINQWRNTKNNIKKRDYEYRRNCNATGGGPRPTSPPPEDVEIMQLLPKEFEIDNNLYDSDSLNLKKDNLLKKNIKPDGDEQPGCSVVLCTSPLLQPQITETVMIPASEIADDKTGKKQHILKKNKAHKKKVTPDISQQNELFKLAKSAREKQMQFQEIEHKRRMEILEEEHQIRAKIMKKELEFWEKKLAE